MDRYVSLGVNFSVYRNGSWTPIQSARGKLFDKPIFDSSAEATDVKSIEALYTLKVQSHSRPRPASAPPCSSTSSGSCTFTVKNMYNEPNRPDELPGDFISRCQYDVQPLPSRRASRPGGIRWTLQRLGVEQLRGPWSIPTTSNRMLTSPSASPS